MQHNDGYTESVYSFANNINNITATASPTTTIRHVLIVVTFPSHNNRLW